MKLIEKIIGSYSERQVKKILPIVDKIEALAPTYKNMTDEELRGVTDKLKSRLSGIETLDDILPDAFAAVREAADRVLGKRPFRVQLMGGIILHQGRIAEMKTGEGKTLVATLPAYLNALKGEGVHIVTVNDYLARRDSEEMGKVYGFLGLTTGLVVHGQTREAKQNAYNADITYGTNNEFGFDYLRDNMVLYREQCVQRGHAFAIVDEVDSILIDEARTPLIISGPGEKSTDLYYTLAHIVKTFEKEDYTMDEKQKTIAPTESGVAKVEKMLGIKNMFDNDHLDLNHLVIQALRARFMMHRDKDYVVKDGEIVIVDEFTGRLMFGRRYSDGLHQSIEAKENVKVQGESKTLATITFQNYFRMYDKLAGMTGTAKTEEDEFNKIYKLDVYVIPTNKPAIRKDLPDVIYKTKHAKYRAVVREVKKRHETGQPILVGTTSISQSEIISQLLKKENIVHNVLNAKYHEKEAEIIKDAGQMNMVTIATNMAGRGTDIKLGKGVAELGGLMIIGTERHESRRIDNQLRGRAGRQGDPGTTQFFLSLEDDLMRIFGSENISKFMDKLGMDEDEPITHSMITRSIEKAQKKVESHNFEIRKYVLEYDDVMNQQREVLYGQRRKVLVAESLRDTILGMVDDIILDGLDRYADEKLYPEEWDFAGLLAQMEQYFVPKGTVTVEELENLSRIEVQEKLKDIAVSLYDEREKEIGAETMRELEKAIMLRVVDSKWMDHLDAMDALKEGINLRAYGQKNPLVEYKFEAYEMFEEMIDSIKRTVITFLYHIQVTYSKPVPKAEDRLQGATEVHEESKPVSREDIERDEQRKQQQQD